MTHAVRGDFIAPDFVPPNVRPPRPVWKVVCAMWLAQRLHVRMVERDGTVAYAVQMRAADGEKIIIPLGRLQYDDERGLFDRANSVD